MNRSRIFFTLILLLACIVSAPPLARVALADSTVSGSPASVSPASEAPASESTASPDSILTIHPYNGPSFEVTYVGYWSMDSFRYRTVKGETGFLTASRIRSIEGQDKKDLLSEMLRERSSFGVFRPGPPHSTEPSLKRPFHAKPLRDRVQYLVLEFGTSARAAGSVRDELHNALFSTGIGVIRNLSPRWGLGGMVQFQSDGDDYRVIAAGVRLRRYLTRSFAVETTQGLFETTKRGHKGVPYFGEVAVSAADAVSLFTRVENQTFEPTYFAFGSIPRQPESSGVTVHVGIRLGPRPNYLTIPGFVVGSLVALTKGSSEDVPVYTP